MHSVAYLDNVNPSSFPSPTEGYRVWGLALNKEVIGSRGIFGVGGQRKERRRREGRVPRFLSCPFSCPSDRLARRRRHLPLSARPSMTCPARIQSKKTKRGNGFYSDERIWVSVATLRCASTPLSEAFPLAMLSSSFEF